MTGTDDLRIAMTKSFVENLKANGFNVESSWPKTGHTPTDATRAEFERYAKEAAAFFKRVTAAM